MRAPPFPNAQILRWRVSTVSSGPLADRPAPAQPVTPEEFDARLKTLRVERDFAVAISGGRDSMALLRLAAVHKEQTGARVLALSVDHGLRPEAAQEAAQVAQWASALGLDHQIFRWTEDKPATGVQEAARNVRYALLAGAVRDAGLKALLTAHSADDQAETVFMRLSRGASPRGLAAMNDETLIAAGPDEPIRLVRPLLPFSRARLTATVKFFDQPFVDDPSNDDPAYERIRIRALLAALEQQGLLSQTALLRTAKHMRKADKRLRAAEEALLRALGGCFYSWGGASLDLNSSKEIPGKQASGLCARLIFAVNGEARPPHEEAAGAAWDQAIAAGAATLGGALIKSDRDRLWFLREPAAVLGRADLAPKESVGAAPGARIVWDNRFIVTAGSESVDISALGTGAAKALGPAAALFSGPREGLFALPGAYHKGVLIGAPGLLSMATSGCQATSLARERFIGEIIRFS